jgi:hypothetical protein
MSTLAILYPLLIYRHGGTHPSPGKPHTCTLPVADRLAMILIFTFFFNPSPILSACLLSCVLRSQVIIPDWGVEDNMIWSLEEWKIKWSDLRLKHLSKILFFHTVKAIPSQTFSSTTPRVPYHSKYISVHVQLAGNIFTCFFCHPVNVPIYFHL